jgi:hypothetical protein
VSIAARNGPFDTAGVRAGRVEQHGEGLMRLAREEHHDDQDDAENAHADELGDGADVVHEGHDLDAPDVERHRHHREEQGDEEERPARGLPAEQAAGDGRGAERHTGHRDQQGEQEHPGREPAPGACREVLGPLHHAAGEREVRRRLGEHESHHELAEHDDGPAPEDAGRPARVEAVVEEREEAVRRRDETEGDGERGEKAERAVEFLLVAELGEELLILLVLLVLLAVEHAVVL